MTRLTSHSRRQPRPAALTAGPLTIGLVFTGFLLALTADNVARAADPAATPGAMSTSIVAPPTPAEIHRNNVTAALAFAGQDSPLRQAVCASAFITTYVEESAPPVHDPYDLDQELFNQYVVDNEPVASFGARDQEVTCYELAVLAAKTADLNELSRRAQRGVTMTHLREDPDTYRAKLVHVEGELRRVLRFEPLKSLKKQGVKDLYEGWIYDHRARRFFVVITTELPPPIRLGDELGWTVSFDGYFFKKYGYAAASGKALAAPLLIGRSVVIPAPPANPISGMLYLFMMFVVVVFGLIVSLAFWYSRHDHHHRVQIGRALSVQRFELEPDDNPAPTKPPVPYAVPLRMTRPPRPEDDSDDKTGFGKATLSPFG